VADNPGLNATDLKNTVPGGNRDFAPAKREALQKGLIHTQNAAGSRAVLHYPGPGE